MKLKILALLTILLLALTACKSTEDPVDDKKPLKLSERVGVYKGSKALSETISIYAIVEVKDTGAVLCNWAVADTVGRATHPILDTEDTSTFFVQTDADNAMQSEITFTSKTALKFKSLDNSFTLDFITLTK